MNVEEYIALQQKLRNDKHQQNGPSGTITVHLLMISISDWDDKAQYPGVIIDDIPLRSVAGEERDRLSVVIQLLLQIGYLIGEGKGSLGVLFFSLSSHGGKALGNVEDGDGVVLVELHHSFGKGGGDGSCWSHRGPYGGRRANGRLN
jgi:hypothetical protein